MSQFVEWFNLSFQILVIPGILFFIVLGFFFDWVYRKLMARLQSRKGPSMTGPMGLFQSFADFIKTCSKEEIIPDNARKLIFKYLPYLTPLPALLGLFLIPIIDDEALIGSVGDLYLFIFILTVFAAMEITLGWASGNSYAYIGASRSGLQLISFGIPLMFSAIVPALFAGSFSFAEIIAYQSTTRFGFLPNWTIFGIGFFAFIIFVISALAELEKVPFDTPEAETEIAGGWTLEYSGPAYGFIILSEQLKEVLMVALAVTLFLGGPIGPTFGFDGIIRSILFLTYFLLKSLFVILVLSLISAGGARFKVSQIVEGTWRLLAPISIIVVSLAVIFNR